MGDPTESNVNLLDIKHSLDTLCNAVELLTKSNEDKEVKIDNLIQKVNSLEKIIVAKDKKISELEHRVSELESFTNEMKRYTLKNNVIIKGLSLKKPVRSFAAVAMEPAPESNPSENPEEVKAGTRSSTPGSDMFRLVRKQVVEFVNSSMSVDIVEEDICAAHELKKGPMDSVPPLVVRFAYTSTKQDVMASRKNLRRTAKDIYINDQLTMMNGKIFSRARFLKRNGVFHAVWTTLGKVIVKRTESSSPIWIKTLAELPAQG